jgi:hypothetical protein
VLLTGRENKPRPFSLEVGAMEDSLYVLKVLVDGELAEYEYGNIKHAMEHYDMETAAFLYEYKQGNYYFVCAK